MITKTNIKIGRFQLSFDEFAYSNMADCQVEDKELNVDMEVKMPTSVQISYAPKNKLDSNGLLKYKTNKNNVLNISNIKSYSKNGNLIDFYTPMGKDGKFEDLFKKMSFNTINDLAKNNPNEFVYEFCRTDKEKVCKIAIILAGYETLLENKVISQNSEYLKEDIEEMMSNKTLLNRRDIDKVYNRVVEVVPNDEIREKFEFGDELTEREKQLSKNNETIKL